MKLDIIIPSYNEETNVFNIYKAITKALKKIKYNLIFVDDGSTDNTYKELKKIYNQDQEHVKVIRFSRNFGKDAAIYAGMKEVTAEYACIIDADLQQNPELILDMLKKIEAEEDVDVICMVNDYSNEIWLSKFLKKWFYRIMNRICDQSKFKAGASDFRLFKKNVCDAILSLDENNRFSKGLFAWVGFNTLYMPYQAAKRTSGKSKFRLGKQISYAIDGLTNFSTKPLRIATVIGSLVSFVAFILLVVLIVQSICGLRAFKTTTTLICILLLLVGIILLVVGIMGEYVAKVYLESKNRPIYIEKEKLSQKK